MIEIGERRSPQNVAIDGTVDMQELSRPNRSRTALLGAPNFSIFDGCARLAGTNSVRVTPVNFQPRPPRSAAQAATFATSAQTDRLRA